METPSVIEERAAAQAARVAAVAARNLSLASRFARRVLPPTMERVPGVVLRLYREAAGVPLGRVGPVMDLSKQMVSKMEHEGASIATAGRYRAAVDLVAADDLTRATP